MIDDPALVFVDFQNNFCDPECNSKLASDDEATAAVEDAVERASTFLDRYRASGRTPILVRTLHDEATVPASMRERSEDAPGPGPCLAETRRAAFTDGVGVHDGDVVVTKRRYGAFYGTDLDVYLSANDVSRLFVGGVNTHLCVLATSFGAADRGYDVTVLSDCTAASSGGEHESGLDVLSTVATDVRPSTAVELPETPPRSGPDR